MKDIDVYIKKLPNLGNLPLPAYATIHSAGLDLMAAIEQPITLTPLQRILVPCGFSIALPEGFEAQVRPRSGLALKHGITVLNTPGTIDADYRGEIKVILINLGQEDFTTEVGMKCAQMIITKYNRITWNLVYDLEESARGEGGFGSTGS